MITDLTLKVFLRVIDGRIYTTCEEKSGETQFGFIKGLVRERLCFQSNLLLHQKAFDNVKHYILLNRLLDVGIDAKDIRIIQELYWNQIAEIRVNNKNLTTDTFNVRKGVRQGCILSSIR